MNNYLIVPLKSSKDDPQALFVEIRDFVNSLLEAKKTLTVEQLYENFGAEIANWITTTDLNTLKTDHAMTEDGQLILGLHGEKDEGSAPLV